MTYGGLSPSIFHEIPSDLQEALLAHPEAAEAWNAGITAIARNEWTCWVEDAKQQVTREKRITRAVSDLSDGKKRPCCWPGCIHRTDKAPSPWATKNLVEAVQKHDG